MVMVKNRDIVTPRRKPPWLKICLSPPGAHAKVRRVLAKHNLHTVCEEARCPNTQKCWGGGTLTFMILGNTCTRSCGFCAVKTGNPRGELDPNEPLRVASAVKEMGLKHVVLTSVDRDDLPDGGAEHFVKTVKAVRSVCPGVGVEVLIPDFGGELEPLRRVVEARPDVVGHNLETVESLTPKLRDPRAGYRQSLRVLENVKKFDSSIYTKSSLMLGLGETEAEVFRAMRDLRGVGVDVLTLGQYLPPTRRHLQAKEYLPPERFEHFKGYAEKLGFPVVLAGPFVRSSYKAGLVFKFLSG